VDTTLMVILKTFLIVVRALFYWTTGFWPSYCQISIDLDKILDTYCCTKYTCGPILDRGGRL